MARGHGGYMRRLAHLQAEHPSGAVDVGEEVGARRAGGLVGDYGETPALM